MYIHIFSIKGNLLHIKNEIHIQNHTSKKVIKSQRKCSYSTYISLEKFNFLSLDQQSLFNMEVLKV